MPAATKLSAELEILTFLSDTNTQARQVAVSNVVGFSAKNSPKRNLLIDKHKGPDGKPLKGRDGEEVDTIEDLKKLCRDQPISAHDAFSALINLSDSPTVSRRIGDNAFLEFLVGYIAEPVSLLADLACMLLSNLTKLDPISSQLLSLQVTARPFYSFLSSADAAAAINGMDAEPTDADYEERRAAAKQHEARLAEQAKRSEERVPALSRLLDAFEEGATVENQGVDAMKQRVLEAAQKRVPTETQGDNVERGPDGRPKIRRKSNCNFLASVFANVTVLPRGRDWFVQPLSTSSAAASASAQADVLRAQEASEKGASTTAAAPPAKEFPVARIMSFTEHPDLIRRGGVISALKNILFIKSAHPMLIAPPPIIPSKIEVAGAPLPTSRPPSSIDVLPYLLLPLCSGTELADLDPDEQEVLPEACQFLDEDKRREPDRALRLMLVESLLLLCTGLYARQCLRGRGVYYVVRAAHLKENDEKIAEAVVRLVNILQRDESASSIAEAAAAEGAGDIDVGADEEPEPASDDEDMAIEEL